MKVVFMQERHIPALAALEKACFSAPWSEAALREELHNPCALFLVAEDQNSVAGYIGCQTVLDEGYIANVATALAYRRKGIGRALVAELIGRAAAQGLAFLTLEVRVSNEPAIALYKSAGFEQAGRRKGYYTNPREDALLMTLHFSGQAEKSTGG